MSSEKNLNDAPQNYSDEDLIEAYLLQNTGKGDDSHLWAFSELDSLVRDNPERAWPIILVLTERAPDEDFVAFLAAGPIEVLLSDHGLQFIERVEERAANDPRFNHMLGGVWRLGMSEDIWSRLTKARKEVW